MTQLYKAYKAESKNKAKKKIPNKIIFLVMILAYCSIFFCKKNENIEIDKSLTFYSKPQAGVLPYFKSDVMDSYWKQSQTEKLPTDLKKFITFHFKDHNNKNFNNESIRGYITLTNFFYTVCRGICPAITVNMQKLSHLIKDQEKIKFLSISVDPSNDDVKAISKFRNRFKITQANWTFLTGPESQTLNLARKSFNADTKVISKKLDLREFLHTENIYLVDKRGYLRGVYRGRGTGDFNRLLADLKTLRSEG